MGKDEEKKPSVTVGVGILVRNNKGQVLMLQRRGVHGDSEWALPGGSVEFGESFNQAAIRELKEETALKAENPRVVTLSNQTRYLDQGIHCVIIGVEVEVCDFSGMRTVEPHKASVLKWFDINKLPTNIFEGSEQILQGLQNRGDKIVHVY